MPPPPPPSTKTFTHSPTLDPYTLPLPTFLTTPHHPHPHTLTPTTHIVTGALIFAPNRSPPPSTTTTTTTTILPTQPPEKQRILLLRRAPTDSYPGRWEAPGGSCDATDGSVLAGAAREVYEETGLRVSRFRALVGVDAWEVVRADGVRKVVKFTFLVEVEPPSVTRSGGEGGQGEEVDGRVGVEGHGDGGGRGGGIRLEPAEHDAFVWATEEEVRAGVVWWQGERVGMEFVGRQRGNYLRGFEVVRALRGVL